jgi:hypothetical protein
MVTIGIGVMPADLASVMVCSLPLLRAALRQLSYFLVSEQHLLQEAAVVALARVLHFIAIDRDHLSGDTISEMFNDLFKRMPQILDCFSNWMIQDSSINCRHRHSIHSAMRKVAGYGKRADRTLAGGVAGKPGSRRAIGNLFLGFCVMNWLQLAAFLYRLLPRVSERFQFLGQAIKECQAQESLRVCKNILTDLFAKVAVSPVDDAISIDLLPLFMDDVEVPDARCSAILSLLANSLKLEFWDQPGVLQELFQKAIFHVNAMPQSEFDFNIAFYSENCCCNCSSPVLQIESARYSPRVIHGCQEATLGVTIRKWHTRPALARKFEPR